MRSSSTAIGVDLRGSGRRALGATACPALSARLPPPVPSTSAKTIATANGTATSANLRLR